MSALIEPFRVAVPQADLDDLRDRLSRTRWPDAELVEDWSQGVPKAYLQDICRYWAEQYDWRAFESRLNALPQFRTEIDGVDIHFIHVRSPEPTARPLVLTHGWPGSIVEFLKVIGPLSDPAAHGGDPANAFHVVVPSLPGYGFSGKPTALGWNIERIADAWADLMARLGYDRYFAQGGDWGSGVTAAIGRQDPGHCAGIHVNMPSGAHPRSRDTDLTPLEERAVAAARFYRDWDSGYSKQQSTRPQTLGYALADSPSGQAAWIIEKFYAWTDCDGHPENALTRDEMLDNVSVYWFTGTATSSARLYWESFNSLTRDPVPVPSGITIFPKEIFQASRRWCEKGYPNLVYWSERDKGGHFAAFEQPVAFIEEVRACFESMR